MTMETVKINLADFGSLFRSDPAKLSDQELLSLDFILHRAWEMKRSGHKVFENGKDWDYPELLELHAAARRELSSRAFHHAINDELEAQTQPLLRSVTDGEPEDPLAAFDRPPAFVIRAVVTRVDEGRVPDTADIYFGLDFQNMKATELVRSVQGRLFLEAGLVESSEAKSDAGDIVEVECDGMALSKRADGTTAISVSASRISSVAGRGKPMTVGEAAKAARTAGALYEGDAAEELLKGVRAAFGSYGGKRALAHKIVSYIPYHKLYVEPFAGGAAVLYAKDPSPQEALNDRDPEIAFMHRFIRDHSPEDRAALAKREWTIRKETHERLKELKPESDRDRFYKSFYLTRSSYGKMRGGSFNPANAGVRIDFPANIERAQARLKNVAVSNKDYLDVLKEHDGPETFFYMDPPYPGKFNLFDFGFKHEDFLKAIKGLKANWIVSYPKEMAGAMKSWNVYKVKRRNQMKGAGGNQEWITELLVSKFPLKPLHLYIEKELEAEPEGLEAEARPLFNHLDDDEVEKVQGAFKSPGGKYRMCKKIVRLMPEHKSYIEGFAGGAQVLFHKKRSDLEAINDVNADLIWAYRFIKGMTPEDLDWLKKQNWIITRPQAKKLFELKPRTFRERFYRFAYLNKAQYWGRTDVWEGMRPNGSTGIGAHIRLVDKLPKIQERLQGVKLHSWDWKDVVKEYDGPNAFFYLDPPYPLHWPKEKGKFGAKFFKEEDMMPVLKSIKGQFLLSYELEKAKLFKGFKTYRIKTLHTGSHQLGGARKEYELLVANYALKPGDLYVEKNIACATGGMILNADAQ